MSTEGGNQGGGGDNIVDIFSRRRNAQNQAGSDQVEQQLPNDEVEVYRAQENELAQTLYDIENRIEIAIDNLESADPNSIEPTIAALSQLVDESITVFIFKKYRMRLMILLVAIGQNKLKKYTDDLAEKATDLMEKIKATIPSQ